MVITLLFGGAIFCHCDVNHSAPAQLSLPVQEELSIPREGRELTKKLIKIPPKHKYKSYKENRDKCKELKLPKQLSKRLKLLRQEKK